jgi:PAS domain S-box-containing protein
MHPSTSTSSAKTIRITSVNEKPMETCVVRKDRQGHIQYVNDAFCQCFGQSREELMGRTDFDLFSEKAAQTLVQRDQDVMASGRGEHVIQQHVMTDGTHQFVEVLRIPVFGEDGQAVGIEIAFWDVSEQREAESESQQAEFLLETLLQNIPDSVYFKDEKSRFIRISHAQVKHFGVADASELIGKTDADFFGQEHAEGALADERRIMETGEPIVGKVELENWDDQDDTWCSTTKVPLRDATGKIIGTFGISRDVTQQMRAELELARERDLLKTITTNIPDIIYVKDRCGRFITGNVATLKMYGIDSVDDLVGKTDYDFLPAEMACNYVADDQIVMRTGQPMLGQEESSQRSDGSLIWLSTTKVPLHGEDGKVMGMVGIGRDITQRKKADEELLAAKDAADSANRAKSEFLANMSHEIRTPMNGIIGMTELLSATTLNGEQREFLGLVQESARSLLRLLNDILDFSKIEAGRMELEEVHFNLRDCVGKAVKLLTFKAEEKGLELAGRIDPSIPNQVIGDPGRLRQIIVNFVGNAIKFTEDGEVVVDVNPQELTPDSALLHVTVRDTGIGIPEEKQQKIFEEFAQADSSTTREFGGTGLGLTISSRLIELMGGRVWVESQAGLGTTFHFLVRLGIVPDQTPRRPAELSRLAGMPVLVVDDNSTNRRILEEILHQWQMLPVLAESGPKALDIVAKYQDDGKNLGMILLDFHMPEMDGLEFAEALKRQSPDAYGPIVILSSSVSGLDPPRLRSVGVERYMTKPVIASELLEAVLGVMGVVGEKSDTPVVAPSASPLQSPRKILLVEDGLVNQRVALGFLRKWGHDVTLAVNGREAVENAKREQFDLILMDIQMPELNGYEATAAIREFEKDSDDRRFIVAMTAEAMKGDREKCLESGMDEYISKPFDPQDLQRVIGLSKTSLLSTPPPTPPPPPTPAPVEQPLKKLSPNPTIGDKELIAEIAEAYVEEAPQLLVQLRRAMEAGDAELLARAAHTLKGASRYFGVQSIDVDAQMIESNAKGNDRNLIEPAIARLEQDCGRLVQELRARLDSVGE